MGEWKRDTLGHGGKGGKRELPEEKTRIADMICVITKKKKKKPRKLLLVFFVLLFVFKKSSIENSNRN